ncbi:WD40 repeat-like protein [Suillus weaverae]|nr:WD40 repeat-like protein [Suillus weaverae]
MLIPLTFPAYASIQDASSPSISVIESDSNLEQTASFVSWRTENGLHHTAVGSSKGTINVFSFCFTNTPNSDSRARPTLALPSEHNPPSAPSSSPSHSRRHSRSLQSPSSLSFNQALINVSARARVVSGVSREQVEAPKNYVDFEDEPGRLKDILKSNSKPRRTLADSILPSFDRGVVIEQSPAPASPPLLPVLPNSPSGTSSTGKNKGDPKSLLSATTSPTFPSGSLSAPPSPRQLSPPFDDLQSRGTVKESIILDPCRHGHAASAMRYIEVVNLLIVLQESGNLSAFDMRDSSCVATCECTTTRSYQDQFWKWEAIRMVPMGDKTYLILACASPSQPPFAETFGLADEPHDSKARLNMFELSVGDPHGVHQTRFERLASDVWQVDGPAAGIELLMNGSFQLVYINSTNYLVTRYLTIIPAYEIRARGSSPAHSQEDHTSLAIPNPFKVFGSKSVESVAHLGQNHNSGTEQESIPTIATSNLGRVRLGEEESRGVVISSPEFLLEGITARYAGLNERIIGLAWSNTDIMVREQEGSLTTFAVPFRSRGKIQGVHFMDDEAFVVLSDTISHYCLRRVDADDNSATTFSGTSIITQAIQMMTISGGPSLMLSWSRSSPHEVLALRQLRSGQKEILVHTINPRQDVSTKQQHRRLWRSQSPSSGTIPGGATLMSVLPVELNFVLLGYSDGYIRQTSLPCLLQRNDVLFDKVSDVGLPSSILNMHLVRNDRTGERYILGGTDDGGIAIWTLESLKLQARFTPFIVPLARVAQVLQSNETAGPLRGSLLCVSGDGTIAVVSIEGFEMLYLIPGASSPIAHIYAGGDDNNRAILIYADGSARVWDVEPGEFIRATTEEKAKELVDAGGWIDISLDKSELTSISISMFNGSAGPVSLCTLLLSLDRFLKYTSVNVKSSGIALSSSSAPSNATLSQLRAVLSVLLTPGLSPDIDEICENRLGTSPSPSTVGFASAHATTIYHYDHPIHAWSISAKVSADRILAIVSVLRTLSLAEELSQDCQTVITFYSTSLAHVVGPSYQAPDVAYLATQWFDSSNDVRQAAKTLFDAGIVRLSDEESIAFVDAWQHHLPCLQPSIEKESAKSSLALFVCGYMAAEKYSLLSTSSLTDISKSIALYLHDESSAHRGLAIDLCARGFKIWQHYIDAMAMLRALYTLATNTRKETISAQNIGPQARLAVLQIASSNTALFMTTLTLDILNPKTLDQRKAVMQLVAFMIRKRPLILYPNLPRLMEAVVKSLDPNSTASRDAVLDSATEIIGHVVKTFPTVDFHMATQRLAVGTSEGAFIMYDLKTATQLYVLEGHKRRPAACTFSPDGRRLVTMSLEEGVVLVWKVGSSFTSFFNPGAPPRQGHGGSLPFKTLNFNVGDEANMTITGTLEWVKFEWPAERTVRLHIRESVLTFST